MGVEVRPVGSRRERKLFLEYPWSVYRDTPQWIPPLRKNQQEMVGYAHNPFHDDAEVQTFLAWRDGQVCGRIAAILNHAHNRFQRDNRGFFGFFESIDDQAVATALLDAVRDWLKQRGIEEIRGPANPSLNHECGLLVDGFDLPPTFMMTYNPPYYARLIETYGFRKVQDLFAFYGTINQLPEIAERIGPIIAYAEERFEIVTRGLNVKKFRAEIEMFLEVYNRSMVEMWGFVPMSPGEIRTMAAAMRHLIIPELTVVAMIEGEPIGALFGLPDYNPRIKEIDGRLFPFGVFKLLNKRRPFRRLRVISANVLPEYQRWGVGLVLVKGLVPKLLSSNIQEVEFSWVAESNKLSRGSLEKGGARIEKTYRMYDFPGHELEPAPEPEKKARKSMKNRP